MRNLKLASTLWLVLSAAPLPLCAGGLGSAVQALRAALPAPQPEEGLVILKLREGAAFDLEDFVAHPERYSEGFAPLTREADEDDWTVSEGKGRIITRLDREDLFIVAAGPGLTLDVEWGDMPLARFFERQLASEPDADGCYSSLRSGLRNRDGSPTRVPHRVFYCPSDSALLFDAPEGYEIGLSALRGKQRVERTEASPLVSDNLRLYARQVYPRSPSARSQGSVLANTRAGLLDAGHDLRDAFGHAVTGTHRTNIHTGQETYRPSPLTAAPLFFWHLFHLEPGRGLQALFAGPASGVQVAADLVSASTNAVLNPVIQASVGSVSPRAADRTGDALGTGLQVLAKNLPFAERAMDAWNPMSFVQHDRAFYPATYTRTDLQLTIDRTAAVIDLHLIDRVRSRSDDDSRRRRSSEDGDPQGAEDGSGTPGGDGSGTPGGDVPPGGGGGGDVPPVGGGGGDVPPVGGGGGDVPPVGGGGGGDVPPVGGGGGDVPPPPPPGGGGGDTPPGGGGGGTPCPSRGGPNGGGAGGSPNASQSAIDHLEDLFCSHPILDGLLPTR